VKPMMIDSWTTASGAMPRPKMSRPSTCASA
jgi:hypothetical protein